MKTKSVLNGMGVVLLASLLAACSNPMASNSDMTSSRSMSNRSIMSIDAPSLGMASSFAVFGGGAGVTNQGTQTQILGDMGSTGASTMMTGFHTSTFSYAETPLNIGAVSGGMYTNAPEGSTADFEIAQAVAYDALAAFNDLASRPDGMDPGAGQLGGLTLVPGVYKSASGAFLITGSDLTLDAQGDADAIWIFQMASSLTVGTPTASSSVILINGAQAENVFWQVGSSATINGSGGGSMAGTIIASAGATFSTAGNETVTILNGRVLGLFASVTMVNTIINTGDSPMAPPVEAPLPEPVLSNITISGSAAAAVVAVPGNGILVIENNGGLVSVTETGTGTIQIANNGGILTATNTGNGLMKISSNATGVVTVTNTGNGNITVNATGAEAVTITHTGDDDYTYPAI